MHNFYWLKMQHKTHDLEIIFSANDLPKSTEVDTAPANSTGNSSGIINTTFYSRTVVDFINWSKEHSIPLDFSFKLKSGNFNQSNGMINDYDIHLKFEKEEDKSLFILTWL